MLSRRSLVRAFGASLVAGGSSASGEGLQDTTLGFQGAEGTWLVTVTFDATGEQEASVISFVLGGTLIEVNTKTRFSGLGLWRMTSITTFRYSFYEQLFDPQGIYFGYVRVHQEATLLEQGMNYTAHGSGVMYTPDGTVVAEQQTHSEGKRFVL